MSRLWATTFIAAGVARAQTVAQSPCTGPKTFSELRQTWDPLWKDTRPGHASNNWTEHLPGTSVPPDDVQFQLKVYGLREVDSVSQTIKVDAFLRSMWTDPRLAFTPTSEGGCFTNSWNPEGEVGFEGSPSDSTWTPGVALMNADKPELVQYSAWWVYPSGYIWWAKKVEWTVKCAFDFEKLPYDSQVCPMRFIGWRDVDYDIAFSFYNDIPGEVVIQGSGTKQEGVSVEWTVFNLTGAPADPRDAGFSWGGQGLEWTMHFERNSGYYERYFILPMYMIVGFVYLSFFISRQAVPSRTALCALSFLVLTSQSNSLTSNLPRSAKSVWLLGLLFTSQIFVFVAMMEYALVNVLMRVEARVAKSRSAQAEREAKLRRQSQLMKATSSTNGAVEDKQEPPQEQSQELRDQEPGGSSSTAKEAPFVVSFGSDGENVILSNSKEKKKKKGCKDDEETRASFGRLGRLLVSKKSGAMYLKDNHVETVFRVIFMPAYAIAVGVAYSHV